MSNSMICYIYRSEHKADTYLYLAKKDDFSDVPQQLMKAFGAPEFSFQLELTADRSLAKEDPQEVLKNLEAQGYHLQMADDLLIEQMLAAAAAAKAEGVDAVTMITPDTLGTLGEALGPLNDVLEEVLGELGQAMHDPIDKKDLN